MNKIVVADASPLIGMGRIDKISLLTTVFNELLIPSKVAEECLADKQKPGASAIQQAIEQNLIRVESNFMKCAAPEQIVDLDQGEAEAINLALTFNAPILIDEKLGRNIVKRLGLHVIGTLGVLLLAKKYKIIAEISPLIDELTRNGYRLSQELIDKALMLADEQHLV